MKWYGSNIKNPINFIKNKKINFKKKLKINSISLNPLLNLNFKKINFYIPFTWNFILLKKNLSNFSYIYLYSFSYFFFLPVLNKFLLIKFDPQTNVISFNFYFQNNFYLLFWNIFKTIFYSFSKVFFKKLKFKGKGYYIYKNFRNTIAMQFGYSHLKYLYSFFVNVKFLTKTTILIFGLNKIDIYKISFKLFNIKKINIFTGKGIRFSRQIIYRKTGKVSSYR